MGVLSWAQANPTVSATIAEQTRSRSFDFDEAGALHYLQSLLLASLKLHPQTFDETLWKRSPEAYDSALLFFPRGEYPWWETLPTELRWKVSELLDAGLLERE